MTTGRELGGLHCGLIVTVVDDDNLAPAVAQRRGQAVQQRPDVLLLMTAWDHDRDVKTLGDARLERFLPSATREGDQNAPGQRLVPQDDERRPATAVGLQSDSTHARMQHIAQSTLDSLETTVAAYGRVTGGQTGGEERAGCAAEWCFRTAGHATWPRRPPP